MERFLKSRYKIGDKISENPLSVTYRGNFLGTQQLLETEKPVVIKIYKRGTLNSSLIGRMKQKVKELSFVNYHGIARLIDGDYGWQGFYYVREYIQGQSLKEILEKGERIGTEKAALIAEEISRALEFAHKRGIIHGALKPSNIFIDSKGTVKVADFVIEGEIKESLPQKVLCILEDSCYISPEELLGKPAAPSSDIYCLGLILFELLVEKTPLLQKDFLESMRKMRASSVLSQEKLALLPRYLQEIVGKALQFDPLLRFASVSEFRESLESKKLVLTPSPHREYANIFENTVTQYGEEFKLEGEALEDLGRVRIKWGKEKHRNWILAAVLMLAVLAGLLYSFFFGR